MKKDIYILLPNKNIRIYISLKYLDISGWDLTNCVKYTEMFNKCNALKTIRMVGCNQATIDLINSVKKSVSTIVTT